MTNEAVCGLVTEETGDLQWIADRYRIERRLGSGGAGNVYLATDVQEGHPVAVKHSRIDRPHLGAAIAREGRLMQTLAHPHVPIVYDVGEREDGHAFFVTQWIDGPSLYEVLERTGPISLAEALQVVTNLCEVLVLAHDSGVLHRDVKAPNVLLPTRNGVPDYARAKLIDFSIAAKVSLANEAGQERTALGSVAGTVDCMAPEQLTGRRQTRATDVYGLGITWYAMLFGRTPFAAHEFEHTSRLGPRLPGVYMGPAIARRLTTEVDVPIDPNIDESVRELLLGMLRLDPGQRPATIAEVLTAVRAIRTTMGG
jgi:eukaryotic-like serine/threonine-protein kinase